VLHHDIGLVTDDGTSLLVQVAYYPRYRMTDAKDLIVALMIIAETCAAEAVSDVVASLMERTLDPVGVMVLVEHGTLRTASYRGIFIEVPALRQDVYCLRAMR
jgi:GTP cyclohydrolase I